jgi:hypothetical protein
MDQLKKKKIRRSVLKCIEYDKYMLMLSIPVIENELSLIEQLQFADKSELKKTRDLLYYWKLLLEKE